MRLPQMRRLHKTTTMRERTRMATKMKNRMSLKKRRLPRERNELHNQRPGGEVEEVEAGAEGGQECKH